MNEQMAKMWIQEWMIWLAYEYEFGMGREKNIEEAIKWYKKAGDRESKNRASELEKSLENQT